MFHDSLNIARGFTVQYGAVELRRLADTGGHHVDRRIYDTTICFQSSDRVLVAFEAGSFTSNYSNDVNK